MTSSSIISLAADLEGLADLRRGFPRRMHRPGRRAVGRRGVESRCAGNCAREHAKRAWFPPFAFGRTS